MMNAIILYSGSVCVCMHVCVLMCIETHTMFYGKEGKERVRVRVRVKESLKTLRKSHFPLLYNSVYCKLTSWQVVYSSCQQTYQISELNRQQIVPLEK